MSDFHHVKFSRSGTIDKKGGKIRNKGCVLPRSERCSRGVRTSLLGNADNQRYLKRGVKYDKNPIY